jgi:hypothetical protein
MRLYELFTTNIKQSKIDDKHKRTNRQAYGYRRGDPGVGAFGYVQDDDEDPHMVTKKYHEPINPYRDAYTIYISYIAEDNMAQHNPYYPRVYNLHMITDKNDQSMPEFTIEKLIPFKDIESELYETLLDKMFHDGLDTYHSYIKTYGKINDKIALYVSSNLEKAVVGDLSNIKDKKLIQAIKFIAAIVRKHELIPDFNTGNFMIRLSNFGPQLVITDPVEDGI